MQQNKSGYITTTASDHLTQFLVIFSKETPILPTHNIMKRSFKDLNPTKLKTELIKTKWKNKLQMEENNPHFYLRFFLKIIKELLNRQCPIKKVSQKLSCKQKPWVTACLANSNNKENNIYKQFCKS